MPQLKQIFIFMIMLIFFSGSIISCTSQYDRGDGVVLSVKKIHGKDMRPHQATQVGAKTIGTVGAVGGAAAGGFIGLVLASFALASNLEFVAIVLGGAIIGAVAVGSAGAVVGGGVGYLVDTADVNAGLYQYTVKPDNGSKDLTITLYSAPISPQTPVHIFENNGETAIKAK